MVIPGRVTRLLNEAFVIVPRVDGRFAPVKRVIAMLIGAALVGYGAFFLYDVILAAVFFNDPVRRG